jgi:hypothetical protein
MKIVLGVLAIWLVAGSTAHAGTRRFCRQSCASAIEACVQTGTHRRPCRRAILRRCRSDTRICGGTTTTTTTRPYPTTTLHQERVQVEISAADVQTFYESGYSVPAPGFEFVAGDVTIRNVGTASVPTNAIVLRAGGLDYLTYAVYAYPPAAGVCDPYTSVAPGGELTCGLVFHVQEGVMSGHLVLNAYVSPGITSDEFAIPTTTRPYASLSIDAVSEAASTYCTPRPGFKIVTFTVTVASHGATGLSLDLSHFGVTAAGARYASPCGYLDPDPCDYAIGVPVDGSASCSAAFELPSTVAAGTVFYGDGRYAASADFALE